MPIAELPLNLLVLCQVRPFMVISLKPQASTTFSASVGIVGTHHMASRHAWGLAKSHIGSRQISCTVNTGYLNSTPRAPSLHLSRYCHGGSASIKVYFMAAFLKLIYVD